MYIFDLSGLSHSKYDYANNSRKTTTKTFRIDEDVMSKLRSESKNRGISLNMLVNHIIKNFVDWYMFEPKIGMVPISKPIVIEPLKT